MIPLASRRPQAFSLIEAVIAIVILSVAIPSMFWAVRDAAERRVEPVMLARARWLAAEKLEDIVADRHSSLRGYAYVANSSYPTEETLDGFPGFSREVEVIERAANLVSAGTGYKVATVRVRYPVARGETRTLELAAVVADY